MQQSTNILVVDDDIFIRDMLADRLSFRGYQVKTAVNGVVALEMIDHHPFDLVFLDIMMPELDGFEVLEQLRSQECQIPIIVMSALNDLNSIVRCIELGAEDYLYKPIKSQLLWARLRASLQKKRLIDRDKAYVAELHLLRQIDEQLNQTLDRQEIARLTLKWSMEITDAQAGFIGALHEKSHLALWAHVGLPPTPTQTLPLAETGIDVTWFAEADLLQEKIVNASLSPGATHRVLLPIHREQQLQAVLVLEMAQACDPNTLDFLNRLQKHIAIALNNARLYTEVQEASQAKSNFVAMVSHELKNPLHAIQSYIHLLQKSANGSLSEREKNYLEVIKNSAGRIHNLARELDDIAQLEVNTFRLAYTAVSLPLAIQEVCGSLAQQRETKEQQLTISLTDDLPTVWADPQRLNQILTNLISNAIKYTPPRGKITIQAHRETPPDKQPAFVRIVVQDTGIGIIPEDQGKLFTQFFRSPDERVRTEQGTGLGLHITQKLVNLHGGHITFESEYEKGTTFSFTLPVAND